MLPFAGVSTVIHLHHLGKLFYKILAVKLQKEFKFLVLQLPNGNKQFLKRKTIARF